MNSDELKLLKAEVKDREDKRINKLISDSTENTPDKFERIYLNEPIAQLKCSPSEETRILDKRRARESNRKKKNMRRHQKYR